MSGAVTFLGIMAAIVAIMFIVTVIADRHEKRKQHPKEIS